MSLFNTKYWGRGTSQLLGEDLDAYVRRFHDIALLRSSGQRSGIWCKLPWHDEGIHYFLEKLVFFFPSLSNSIVWPNPMIQKLRRVRKPNVRFEEVSLRKEGDHAKPNSTTILMRSKESRSSLEHVLETTLITRENGHMLEQCVRSEIPLIRSIR